MNSFKNSNVVQPAVANNSWVAVDLVPITEDELMKDIASRPGFIYTRRSEPIAEVKKEPVTTYKLWASFAKTTTGHGFARLVDSKEVWWLRMFWTFVMFSLTAVLLISVALISYESLVVRGLRREFIVQHNRTMYLPDIHICDTSLFNRTILQDMGFNNTMGSYLALALSPLLASHALQDNKEKRDAIEKEFRQLMKGRTIQEVFHKAALRCNDIILGCTHETIRYSSSACCRKFFGDRRYASDLATLCVSTHEQPPLEEIFVSQIYGFTVYLKTKSKDKFEFDSSIISSNVASRRGIIYAVSDPITAVTPTISTEGHYTWPGTWTAASITLTRTDNSELQNGILSPHFCVSANSKEHTNLVPGFNVYSERNCVFASFRWVIETTYNCSLFRFHKMGNMSACNPDVMIDAYTPALAHKIKERTLGCPEDCMFDDYHISSSTSHLDLGEQDDMLSEEKLNPQYIHSAIHFFFPSFSFTIIKNHPESLVKWLSDVGGNMSLYLGASFVTLLEFIVLLFQCCVRSPW